MSSSHIYIASAALLLSAVLIPVERMRSFLFTMLVGGAVLAGIGTSLQIICNY